jgi:ABC-2 type transport system ATP-binding protein
MDRWRVSLFGVRLHVITDTDPVQASSSITEQLRQANIQVIDVHEEDFSLEDVFISVVEQARARGSFAREE